MSGTDSRFKLYTASIIVLVCALLGPAAANAQDDGPHQVPKEWADKYKGKFDDGWDRYRERVFARQKKMGWLCEALNYVKSIHSALFTPTIA